MGLQFKARFRSGALGGNADNWPEGCGSSRPKADLQPAPLNARMAAASGYPGLPPLANIRRGKVTTNSVNSSTSLSTEIVPPCAFVTMS